FWFGLSGDEVDMNEYGKVILKYFTSFGSDDTVFHMSRDIDRDGVLMYYGGFFDLICAVINKFSPFAEYTTRHILNAWAGFLAIFFSARIVAYITDKRLATLCVWLMFLSPFFLGHAMNNPKDIPLAAGYIASVYFIIRFFDRFPDVKKTDYLWLILSIGITINIRVAGILLIPYLFVYVGIVYLSKTIGGKENVNLKDYTKPVLILAILGYLAGSLFWPYGQKNPLTNPLTALSEMSNFKINLSQIWQGEKVMSGELPSSYLIKSFFLTNTYALLGGVLLFFAFIRATARSKKAHVIYFVAFTALFPLFYIIYKKSNVYHAWRHVLFIFPSVAVMSVLGWSYLNGYIKSKWQRAGIGLGIAAVLLIEPILFIVPTFPNTVTYYNQFAGGVEGAYGNYEVDYYYNSVKQCTDYFIEHELPNYKPEDTVVIATNSAHLLFPYMKGHNNVKITYVRFHERDQQDWDYALFHIALIPLEEIKAEQWLPPTTVYTAKVKGKPLCALIKRPSKNDLLGFKALQAGNREEAVSYFLKYLDEDSSNINVLSMTARVLMELNRMDSAYTYAAKAYELDKTGVETKRVYAMILAYKGEGEKARSLFKEIISERPDYIAAYYYLGMVEKNMGMYQEALNDFNKVAQVMVQQDPGFAAECYTIMGDIFKSQGDAAQANKMYSLAAGLKK
ncbi:MAG: hypothetical protein KDC07_08925, partial [Chitinophagaceae bacterium]|nr:hypothetical protein [Chitinophagaceae bacterium]